MAVGPNRYDVIYAGNYTKDVIITPDGIRHVDGGGMNYAAHAGMRVGAKVAVVTRLAEEDERVVAALRASGIDCYPVYSATSTQMTLEYKTRNVDQRNLYVKTFAGTIAPEHLDGLAARAVVVSPSLRGEVEPAFFEKLRRRNGIMLSADVQGFVRVMHGESLVYAPWAEMEEVVSTLDVLKSDAVEAEYLTGEANIERAAEKFAAMGAKEIVLTHSEGVLVHAEGQFHHFAFHSQSMAGRSGRGDTCLGSYVAKRLTLPPLESGKWAAAVTSLKVECLGVFDRSMSEIEAFIARYYGG